MSKKHKKRSRLELATSGESDRQHQSQAHRIVDVFWDIENCPVPRGADPFKLAYEQLPGLLSDAIQCDLPLEYRVSAFFHLTKKNQSQLPQKTREALNDAGCDLLEVGSSKGNAADLKMMHKIRQSAASKPAVMVVITGDCDFIPTIRELRACGCEVLLLHPASTKAALCRLASLALSWNEVATWGGQMPCHTRLHLDGCHEQPRLDGCDEQPRLHVCDEQPRLDACHQHSHSPQLNTTCKVAKSSGPPPPQRFRDPTQEDLCDHLLEVLRQRGETAMDVLQIRRCLAGARGELSQRIDKRALNRLLYELHEAGKLDKQQPDPNRKPLWSIRS